MNKKIAVITGASAGMGQEFALQMDNIFHNLDEIWLIARRKERLQELAKVLRTKAKVIQLDMTDELQLQLLEELLESEKPLICMLVNCAGYGYMGAFRKLPLRDQLGMVDLNCKSLTRMTYLCLPFMRRNSRIIQLASSAAFLPQPNFAVYAASKSYVLSFSRALGEELRKDGIAVTAVCPGPVETEFFDIAERYGSTLAVKKLTIVPADRVVREALQASFHRKPVAICSFWIKLFYGLSKLTPHSAMLWCLRFFQ